MVLLGLIDQDHDLRYERAYFSFSKIGCISHEDQVLVTLVSCQKKKKKKIMVELCFGCLRTKKKGIGFPGQVLSGFFNLFF